MNIPQETEARRRLIRFILTGSDSGGVWTDTLINDMLADYGFGDTLRLLAESEIRRLEEEPVRAGEEGGLTLAYGRRGDYYRDIAARCRRGEFDTEAFSGTGISGVWKIHGEN